jgi:hypothetical protein
MKSSTILYKFCLVFCAFWPNIVIARKTFKNAKFRQKSVKKCYFQICLMYAHQSTQNFETNSFMCNVYVFYYNFFALFTKKDIRRSEIESDRIQEICNIKVFFLFLIFETKFSKRIGLCKFSWEFYHFISWHELDIGILFTTHILQPCDVALIVQAIERVLEIPSKWVDNAGSL